MINKIHSELDSVQVSNSKKKEKIHSLLNQKKSTYLDLDLEINSQNFESVNDEYLSLLEQLKFLLISSARKCTKMRKKMKNSIKFVEKTNIFKPLKLRLRKTLKYRLKSIRSNIKTGVLLQ